MTEHTEAALRSALVDAYHYLGRHRLTEQASGNVSARTGERVLISPNGATEETIGAGSFVAVDLAGRVLGSGRPSTELAMHLAIYRACPEASAVVHTHSDACVGLASCREGIPGFHYLVGSFGGNDIPCAGYSVFGGDALAEKAAALLTTRRACLLANHGAVAWGPSLERALLYAHRVEILARQYILARQAGTPVLLSDAEFAEYREKVTRIPYL